MGNGLFGFSGFSIHTLYHSEGFRAVPPETHSINYSSAYDGHHDNTMDRIILTWEKHGHLVVFTFGYLVLGTKVRSVRFWSLSWHCMHSYALNFIYLTFRVYWGDVCCLSRFAFMRDQITWPTYFWNHFVDHFITRAYSFAPDSRFYYFVCSKKSFIEDGNRQDVDQSRWRLSTLAVTTCIAFGGLMWRVHCGFLPCGGQNKHAGYINNTLLIPKYNLY